MLCELVEEFWLSFWEYSYQFMANAYLVYSKRVLEKKMTFCSLTG